MESGAFDGDALRCDPDALRCDPLDPWGPAFFAFAIEAFSRSVLPYGGFILANGGRAA